MPDGAFARAPADASAVAAQPFRIGPNAVTRLAEALGPTEAPALFGAAGYADLLAHPPEHMVDERVVARLHQRLRRDWPAGQADAVARQAGLLTADYLLAHRIPKPVQSILRLLPAPLAIRMLLKAIGRHAWTFAGSGRFVAIPGHPTVVSIADNPTCRGETSDRPVCHYHAAVFERLMRTLVHPQAMVTETDCCAQGGQACVFEIHWR